MDNAEWIFPASSQSTDRGQRLLRSAKLPVTLGITFCMLAGTAGSAAALTDSRSVVHMTGSANPSPSRATAGSARVSTTVKVVAVSAAAAAAATAAIVTNSSHQTLSTAHKPRVGASSAIKALPPAKTSSSAASSSSHAAAVSQTPRVFLVDAHHLAAQKAAYAAGDPQAASAVRSLIKRANKDLAIAPVSVTAKTQIPPSGDKHDYMSLSIYAWPNPNTANGLPYIIKDGDKNPSTASIQDKANLTTVMNAAQELGYAYYFTGNQTYAAKASTILQTWFINPATKMNPNLNYAQAVPGKTDGGSGGIIDTADLPKVVDAVGLLAGAKSWSTTDTDQMKTWFASYLTWLRTSAPGKAEGATINNHLTWYDAQVVSYALFTGQTAFASSVAKSAETAIIAKQIRPDGTQPAELARATSWSYSTYNVEALVRLAQLASNAHVDLWHYKAPNGASIKAAIDYVDGYVTNLSSWPYHQSSKPDLHYLPLALSAAADAYHTGNYQTLANTAIAASSTLYPAASLVFGSTN